MMPALFAAPKTILLPQLPDDEGPYIRSLQARSDAAQLAEQLEDPLKRIIDRDTITLACRADGTFVIPNTAGAGPLTVREDQGGVDASSVTVRGLEEARANLCSPAHVVAEAARKQVVLRAHQARIPVACSCDTRVYQRDDKTLFSSSTVVARRQEEFGRFAVRPNAAALGRSVYLQRLFIFGTYVASHESTVGNEAEAARYRAHLNCLLGPVGDQLLRDYERLPTPWQTGGQVIRWPLLAVTSVMLYGAFYAAALGDSEAKAPEAESRAFHVLHNILLGCCVGYGLLGLVAAGVAFRRRAEHRNVVAFRAVRESHDALLAQRQRSVDTVGAGLQRARDAVVESHSRWAPRPQTVEGSDEQEATLPMGTVAEKALEEMGAYWHFAGEDHGA